MKSEDLRKEIEGLDIDEQLKLLASRFKGKIIFTTSLGIEDQVITHKIFTNKLDIRVITLDTGRLFPQTYDVLSTTVIRYNKKIEVFFPEHIGVEKLVTEKGPLSFYKSVEARKECCRVRKLEPLDRALKGMEIWISGIRAEQSENRNQMDFIEYDQSKHLVKFYPLFHWSWDDVRKFVKENNVPYNTLHDKGFVSIGCEPCTRAIKPGEDFRAGRWWWETGGPKECGCHATKGN